MSNSLHWETVHRGSGREEISMKQTAMTDHIVDMSHIHVETEQYEMSGANSDIRTVKKF